jgi:hypothetical protein
MFRGQPLQAGQQVGPAINAEFNDADVAQLSIVKRRQRQFLQDSLAETKADDDAGDVGRLLDLPPGTSVGEVRA